MDWLNFRLSTCLQLSAELAVQLYSKIADIESMAQSMGSNQWGQTRLILVKQCFIVLFCQDFNQWSLTLLIFNCAAKHGF